ncbi:hypothetical protein AB0I61_02290 [Polymorphospora rubra]|uniref:hypothetical protein n=1 Tax=Polymorphospora rubra TaxID=338584 RepID=UPI0033ECAD29
MTVRRGAIRLATVLALAGGLVVAGAAPAMADEDRVTVKLPGSFKVGAAGGVTVTVAKRTEGCVSVRTALAFNLPQLSPDQVEVQVAVDGEWRRVITSDGGGGLIVTERTAPEKARLCERKSVSMRYRVQFLPGAPSGTVNIVGEAYGNPGGVLDRAAGTRRVTGGVSPTPPRPSKSPTPSPSASPSPEASESAGPTDGAVPVAERSPVAGGAAPSSGGGGFFGVGTVVMSAGVGMVAVGVALLIFLLRRGRRGDDPGPEGGFGFGPPPPPPPGGGDADATRILPRVPY